MRNMLILPPQVFIIDVEEPERIQEQEENTRRLGESGFLRRLVWMALVGGRWQDVLNPGDLLSKTEYGWVFELEDGGVLEAKEVQMIATEPWAETF